MMKLIVPFIFFIALAAAPQERSRWYQSPLYAQAYAELTNIGLAICDHAFDLERLPDDISLKQLSRMELFTEKARGLFQKKDPWGNPYYFKKLGWQFWIGSAGSDGIFKGLDQVGRWEDEKKGEDIIYSSCRFVYCKRRPPATKSLDEVK